MWYRLSARVLEEPEYTYHATPLQFQHPIINTNPDMDHKDMLGGLGGDAYGKGFYTSQNPSVIKGYQNSARPYLRQQKLPEGFKLLQQDSIPQAEAQEIMDWYNQRFFGGRAVMTAQETNYTYSSLSYVIDSAASSVPHQEVPTLREFLDRRGRGNYWMNDHLREMGYDGMEYGAYQNYSGTDEKKKQGQNILVWNDEAINNPHYFRHNRLGYPDPMVQDKSGKWVPKPINRPDFDLENASLAKGLFETHGDDANWCFAVIDNGYKVDYDGDLIVDMSAQKTSIDSKAAIFCRQALHNLDMTQLAAVGQAGTVDIGGKPRTVPQDEVARAIWNLITVRGNGEIAWDIVQNGNVLQVGDVSLDMSSQENNLKRCAEGWQTEKLQGLGLPTLAQIIKNGGVAEMDGRQVPCSPELISEAAWSEVARAGDVAKAWDIVQNKGVLQVDGVDIPLNQTDLARAQRMSIQAEEKTLRTMSLNKLCQAWESGFVEIGGGQNSEYQPLESRNVPCDPKLISIAAWDIIRHNMTLQMGLTDTGYQLQTGTKALDMSEHAEEIVNAERKFLYVSVGKLKLDDLAKVIDSGSVMDILGHKRRVPGEEITNVLVYLLRTNPSALIDVACNDWTFTTPGGATCDLSDHEDDLNPPLTTAIEKQFGAMSLAEMQRAAHPDGTLDVLGKPRTLPGKIIRDVLDQKIASALSQDYDEDNPEIAISLMDDDYPKPDPYGDSGYGGRYDDDDDPDKDEGRGDDPESDDLDSDDLDDGDLDDGDEREPEEFGENGEPLWHSNLGRRRTKTQKNKHRYHRDLSDKHARLADLWGQRWAGAAYLAANNYAFSLFPMPPAQLHQIGAEAVRRHQQAQQEPEEYLDHDPWEFDRDQPGVLTANKSLVDKRMSDLKYTYLNHAPLDDIIEAANAGQPLAVNGMPMALQPQDWSAAIKRRILSGPQNYKHLPASVLAELLKNDGVLRVGGQEFRIREADPSYGQDTMSPSDPSGGVTDPDSYQGWRSVARGALNDKLKDSYHELHDEAYNVKTDDPDEHFGKMDKQGDKFLEAAFAHDMDELRALGRKKSSGTSEAFDSPSYHMGSPESSRVALTNMKLILPHVLTVLRGMIKKHPPTMKAAPKRRQYEQYADYAADLTDELDAQGYDAPPLFPDPSMMSYEYEQGLAHKLIQVINGSNYNDVIEHYVRTGKFLPDEQAQQMQTTARVLRGLVRASSAHDRAGDHRKADALHRVITTLRLQRAP